MESMSQTRRAFSEATDNLEYVSIDILDNLIEYERFDPLFEKDKEEFYKVISKEISELVIKHPNWGVVSGRLLIKSLKTTTPKRFSDFVRIYKDKFNTDYYRFIIENEDVLNDMIVEERDDTLSAFGITTLIRSYLSYIREKGTKKITYVETPQYLYLRNAIQDWMPNLEKIKEEYDDLSLGRYSQASPHMMNSCFKRNQCGSCFLVKVSDNLNSIAKVWRDSAVISKNCGGLGLDYGALRHSEIETTGMSGGLVPWLKIQNEILNSVDQGGKRKGSGTIQIPVWHIDVYEYLDLRKNNGSESMRARDLFTALFIDNIFMERVENDQHYSLFCPNKAFGLNDCNGEDFRKLYLKYENEFEEKYKGEIFYKRVKARELYFQISITIIKTGMPFLIGKDAMNFKSNQKNLGQISTNLCVEISQHCSDKEISSCNLSSKCLNDCVKYNSDGRPEFDFERLDTDIRKIVRNINNVIDRNYYPPEIPEIKYSNLKNRPMGIGVQGLADVFAILDIPFVETDNNTTSDPREPLGSLRLSEKAKKLNNEIFEQMYYSAIDESIEIAKEKGKTYDSYEGSPASQGLLQFDLSNLEGKHTPFNYDIRISKDKWNILREKMSKYGLYNSLLIALMPTASSAQILGNNEAMEPFTENIYARTVLSGQFIIVNKHLVKDFLELGLWNTKIITSIIENGGSIQHIESPEEFSTQQRERLLFLKDKYKTAFEIPQRALLELALDRGRFICQTQSFNIFMKEPTPSKLLAYHYMAWKGGAKTWNYYLRTSSANEAVKFSAKTEKKKSKFKKVKCNDDVCISCIV